MAIPRYERLEDLGRHRFTQNYAQPDAYHFCLDSVMLPKLVAIEYATHAMPPTFRTLDLCAGCGVVGLELWHHLPQLPHIDFLEIQAEFQSFFESNRQAQARDARQARFLNFNYTALGFESLSQGYDLIVANPPYFRPDEGIISPVQVKARARMFLDASPQMLFSAVARALRPGGRAYVLTKSGEDYGRQDSGASALSSQFSVKTHAFIRGTPVLEITAKL